MVWSTNQKKYEKPEIHLASWHRVHISVAFQNVGIYHIAWFFMSNTIADRKGMFVYMRICIISKLKRCRILLHLPRSLEYMRVRMMNNWRQDIAYI